MTEIVGVAREVHNPFSLIKIETYTWLQFAISLVPGRIGFALRSLFYRSLIPGIGKAMRLSPWATISRGAVSIGDRFVMMEHSAVRSNPKAKVSIGRDVSVSTNVIIDATPSGTIEIGNNVLIGPNVVIRAANHGIYDRNKPVHWQGHESGKISIEDGVWICANAVITAHVVIGKHAVIGAGAVITENVPAYAVVGCAPAVVLATR